MNRLITWAKKRWAALSPTIRAQTARFARVAVITAAPQLLAELADPHGVTPRAIAAVASGAIEAAWRAIVPPPETQA